MQVIDDTAMGVRTAVLTLGRRDSSVTYVVIPMLHLGTPRFYDDVRRLIEASDLIVMEGVRGRRVRTLTLAYRLAGRWRRDGLIAQGDGLRLADLRDRITCPDMDARTFAASWRGLRWWMRGLVYVAAPLVGLAMLLLGPERLLRGQMTFEDDPAQRAEWRGDDIDRVLLGPRDALLRAALERIDAEAGDEPATVAICWGAAHVPAIMRTLRDDLGYRVTDARWLRIF